MGSHKSGNVKDIGNNSMPTDAVLSSGDKSRILAWFQLRVAAVARRCEQGLALA